MTNSIMRVIQDNPDRVYFPFMGNDNIFTRGIKVSDTMFTIPGTHFEIKWYGFFIALGLLLALLFAEKNYKKFGIDPDRALTVVLGGGILAVICARTYFVAFSWSDYVVDGKIQWADVVNIRNGGLAIYGGIIGGFIGAYILCKVKKIRVLAMFDLAGMGFLIGQAFGRLGNFTNQEAYGSLTTLPWAMTSNKIMGELGQMYPDVSQNMLLAHPCFLYESLWCILGFVLLVLYKKHRKFDGELFLMYIGWYGAGRAFIEGFRTDSLYIGKTGIRVSQLVGFICAVASIIAIVAVRINIKKKGNYKFFYETEISKQHLLEYDESRKPNSKKAKISKNLNEVIENAFEPDTDASNSNDENAEDLDDIVDNAFNNDENQVDNTDTSIKDENSQEDNDE